jgi:hypothetical protein
MSDTLKEILSEIPGEVADEVINLAVDSWNSKAIHAEQRQDAIAAANHAERPHAVDGIGYLDMSVDSQIYHWWEKRLPGCWRDKDFRNWIKRNFPATVVNSGGTGKTTLLMPGFLNRAAA